jgi:hypothetical protein
MTSNLCMRSRRRTTCKYQILRASRHRAPYCSFNPVESFTTVCMNVHLPIFLFDLDLCNTLLSQKVLLIMNDVQSYSAHLPLSRQHLAILGCFRSKHHILGCAQTTGRRRSKDGATSFAKDATNSSQDQGELPWVPAMSQLYDQHISRCLL